MGNDHGELGPSACGHEIRWSETPSESPSHAVVRSVAALEDRDPIDLPPLYDVTDPEAIDALISADAERGTLHISFRYCGYEIELEPSILRIRPLE